MSVYDTRGLLEFFSRIEKMRYKLLTSALDGKYDTRIDICRYNNMEGNYGQ